MTFAEIIMLSIGLAMDCFAVSLAKGVSAGKFRMWPAMLMALCFGIFQAAMPLAGYLAGTGLSDFIEKAAPWVALVLLGFIGGKMIKEHFGSGDCEEEASDDYGIKTILLLSVATSIDALATGLIFVGRENTILTAITIIGLASFLFSITGTLLGAFFGNRFKFPAGLAGGIILTGIGIKIWIESIFF